MERLLPEFESQVMSPGGKLWSKVVESIAGKQIIAMGKDGLQLAAKYLEENKPDPKGDFSWAVCLLMNLSCREHGYTGPCASLSDQSAWIDWAKAVCNQ